MANSTLTLREAALLTDRIRPIVRLNFQNGRNLLCPGGQPYYVKVDNPEQEPQSYWLTEGHAVGLEFLGDFSLVYPKKLGLIFPSPTEVLLRMPEKYLFLACAYEAVAYHQLPTLLGESEKVVFKVILYQWSPVPILSEEQRVFRYDRPELRSFNIVQSALSLLKKELENSFILFGRKLILNYGWDDGFQEDCFTIGQLVESGLWFWRQTKTYPILTVSVPIQNRSVLRYRMGNLRPSDIIPHLRWAAGYISPDIALEQYNNGN